MKEKIIYGSSCLCEIYCLYLFERSLEINDKIDFTGNFLNHELQPLRPI